jgi:hypothetical protein
MLICPVLRLVEGSGGRLAWEVSSGMGFDSLAAGLRALFLPETQGAYGACYVQVEGPRGQVLTVENRRFEAWCWYDSRNRPRVRVRRLVVARDFGR